jgi:hypothetical protein
LLVKNKITDDIKSKFLSSGKISEKQVQFLNSLLNQRKDLEMNGKPVVEGNEEQTFKILSAKTEDSNFGIVAKILMEHKDGWKVFYKGTSKCFVEIKQIGSYRNPKTSVKLLIQKDDIVKVKGNIQKSNNDRFFGIMKNPKLV